MTDRFYESEAAEGRRQAPAASRNRDPITAVLKDWLPPAGLMLELASGTGEHALHFARAFPNLDWQPSDPDPGALESIAAWRAGANLDNFRAPLRIDAQQEPWPIKRADAVISINMVHISPWEAALGLLNGAARLLAPGAPLILYGPWVENGVDTAESNAAFDQFLRSENPQWGLRHVDQFAAEAKARGLTLAERRAMPANNIMLRFVRD